MGGFYSRGRKDFQSVIPYNDKEKDRKEKERGSSSCVGFGGNESEVINKKIRLNDEKGNEKRIPPKREQSLGPGWVVNLEKFNFDYTEGQHRRTLMANCEDECSEITEFLYVSGGKVSSFVCFYSLSFSV